MHSSVKRLSKGGALQVVTMQESAGENNWRTFNYRALSNDKERDEEGDNWKNLVYEEFGFSRGRLKLPYDDGTFNHPKDFGRFPNWAQPKIQSLHNVEISSDIMEDSNTVRSMNLIGAITPSVAMAVKKQKEMSLVEAPTRTENQTAIYRHRKRSSARAAVPSAKRPENSKREKFRSRLIDLETRMKGSTKTTPAEMIGFLTELSDATSTNAQFRALLVIMIQVLDKGTICAPSYEKALLKEVEYFKDYVHRMESSIKSLEDDVNHARASYGQLEHEVNEIWDHARAVRDANEQCRAKIKDSQFEQLMMQEDLHMMQSEMKWGATSQNIENANIIAAQTRKEALKIIHQHQTAETGAQAMQKIITAYDQREQSLRENGIPRETFTTLQAKRDKLKLEKDWFLKEHLEDQNSYLALSKKVFEQKECVAALKRDIVQMKVKRKELQRSHTPRPHWDHLRSKVDMLDYRKFLRGTVEARIPTWEESSSTKEITDIISRKIHQFVDKARTEESMKLHKAWEKLEEVEKSLARWIGALPTGKQQTEAVLRQNDTGSKEESLASCGSNPAVSLCLRCAPKNTFRRCPMSLTRVRNEIRVIFKSKAMFDHVFGHVSLGNFLYDYSRLEYSQEAKDFSYNFIHSVRKYRKHDGLCDMFYDIFSMQWCENYLHDVENMFGNLLVLFERTGRELHGGDEHHSGTLPLECIPSILQQFFPRKSIQDMEALMKTLKRENLQMHKLLMTQSLESHCEECASHANENVFHEPECLYYRHIFAHYYGLPVCAIHSISSKSTDTGNSEQGLAVVQTRINLANLKKNGFFSRFEMPESHTQHEETHGKHHTDMADDEAVEMSNESKQGNASEENAEDNADNSYHKTLQYRQQKTSFLDLLIHQYKVEINNFVNIVETALENCDYTCQGVVLGSHARIALQKGDPLLPKGVIHRYYELGVADWRAVNRKSSKVHAEDYLDIRIFCNNLRHSFVLPFDIYKGAVCAEGSNTLRPIISFGVNILS